MRVLWIRSRVCRLWVRRGIGLCGVDCYDTEEATAYRSVQVLEPMIRYLPNTHVSVCPWNSELGNIWKVQKEVWDQTVELECLKRHGARSEVIV